MTPRKFAATSAANDEAARIFLADPVKHAGLRLLWARLYSRVDDESSASIRKRNRPPWVRRAVAIRKLRAIAPGYLPLIQLAKSLASDSHAAFSLLPPLYTFDHTTAFALRGSINLALISVWREISS